MEPAARDRSFVRWIPALLALVGVALLVSAVLVARDSWSLRGKDTKVSATIVEIESPPDGGRHPIYEFEYEGETYRHESPVSTATRRTDVGEERELYIDPDDPEKAKETGFIAMWFATIMLTAFGVALLVAALVTWVIMRIVRRLRGSGEPGSVAASQ